MEQPIFARNKAHLELPEAQDSAPMGLNEASENIHG